MASMARGLIGFLLRQVFRLRSRVEAAVVDVENDLTPPVSGSGQRRGRVERGRATASSLRPV